MTPTLSSIAAYTLGHQQTKPETTAINLEWHLPGVIQLSPRTLNTNLPYLIISCGIHGNETAPIEVMSQLMDDLCQGKLALHCQLLVIFGNIPAINTNQRYIDYDMNRLFNGAHQHHPQAVEAKRAAELEQQVGQFFRQAGPASPRLHFDLHTAIRGSVFERFAIYPYLHGKPYSKHVFCWLKQADISTVLLHSKPANTFSYFTSHVWQADSLTLELGKARPFGQNDLSRFSGIDLALRHAISQPQAQFALQLDQFNLFQAKYDLIKHTDCFKLHLSDDVENFTLLPDGYVIAEDETTESIAQGGNERILFPNPKVKPGLRAGIVIEPVSASSLLFDH